MLNSPLQPSSEAPATAPEGLAVPATRGMLWSAVSIFTRQVTQLLLTILLMRLLEPRDFGLVEIVGIFNSIIYIVTDLGISAAIIQRKHLEPRHLDTAYWLNAASNLLIFVLIALLVSPAVAALFGWPILRPLMVVASLPLVFGPWSSQHRLLLQRNLRFAPLALVDISALLVGTAVSVGMALNGYGIWSIVSGPVCSSLVATILIWAVVDWRPRLRFDPSAVRELMQFGTGMVGFRLVNYLGANIDFLVIGRKLGQDILGLYTFAFDWGSFSYNRLTPFIGQVIFPAFSSIQDDNTRLRRGYLRLTALVGLISFPVMAGLCVVAPEFVTVIFPKYTAAIEPLRVLCFAGMLYSINTYTGSIIMSKGRTRLLFWISWVRLIGFGLAVLIGVQFGLIGVAIADLVYVSLTIWFFQWICLRLIDLSLRDWLRALLPSVLVALSMALATLAWKLWLLHGLGLEPGARLALTVPFGALATLAAAWCFQRALLRDLRHTLGLALQPYLRRQAG